MIVTRDYPAIAAFCEYPNGASAGGVRDVLESMKERDREIVTTVYSNDWVCRSCAVRAKAVKGCAEKYKLSVDVVYKILREARRKFLKLQENLQ